MCPRCRLRAVPSGALAQIAAAPELITRTPVGVPSDGLTDTPVNRAVRWFVAAVLCLFAFAIFQGPADVVEQCQAAKRAPSLSVQARSRACESWVWRNIISVASLVTAAGLGVSALRSRDGGGRHR